MTKEILLTNGAMKVLKPKLSSAYESRIKKHEDFVKRLNHLLKLRGEK